MKRNLPMWSLLLLIAFPAAHAQLFKYTGPDGKVVYSDTPPPANAKQVERKAIGSGGSSDADLPYEVAQAKANNPVTLYTSAGCAPCEEGRKLLNSRGIPFSEKTIASNDDIVQFRKVGGDAQLPMLMVGRNKQTGFQSDAWNSALTAGGYPESSKLPKTYRNPQAEGAAPKAVDNNAAKSPETGNNASSESSNPELPPPSGNVPPGFRF